MFLNFLSLDWARTPASWGWPEESWDSDVLDHHRYRKIFPSHSSFGLRHTLTMTDLFHYFFYSECTLHSAEGNSNLLDPSAECSAEVRTACIKTKAVCFLFSRLIYDKCFFFTINITARYMKTVVMKSRYSYQIKLREIITRTRQVQESPLMNKKGLIHNFQRCMFVYGPVCHSTGPAESTQGENTPAYPRSLWTVPSSHVLLKRRLDI